MWLIRRWFAIEAGERITFELTALTNHKWDTDANMESWKMHWDYLLEHQETPLAGTQKEKIL